MKSILTLITLAAAFQMSSARIGETVTECGKRYGSVGLESSDGSFKEYSVKRLMVTCFFVDGKYAIVSYAFRPLSRVIQTPNGKDRRFSEEQAARLLNLNGNGVAWQQKSKVTYTSGNDGIYETADGKLQALVNFVGVSVETVESYRSRLAGMSDEVVDQALVGIGANGGGPTLQTAKFPPSKEEQEATESQAKFKAIQASLEKMQTENKAALEALPKK